MTIDGAEVSLIEGAGGVFEIVRDGELLFSKKQTARFPEDTEIDAIVSNN
jgi:selenoprotein W-related protein